VSAKRGSRGKGEEKPTTPMTYVAKHDALPIPINITVLPVLTTR
jgi:hypothetical protein